MPGKRHPVPCPTCNGMKARYSKMCAACTYAARVRPAEERFWEKVAWSDGCWLWTGGLTKGYGEFLASSDGRRNQVHVYAHRFAYELVVGPIPPGMHIDHLCRTPRCVNPAHLEPVTPQTNTLRSVKLGRAFRTHCPQGHEYSAANTYVSKRNQRHCKTCKLERNRAWRPAA